MKMMEFEACIKKNKWFATWKIRLKMRGMLLESVISDIDASLWAKARQTTATAMVSPWLRKLFQTGSSVTTLKSVFPQILWNFLLQTFEYFYILHMEHTCTEYLGQTYPQSGSVTFLWHCVLWDSEKPLRQLLHFQSSHAFPQGHIKVSSRAAEITFALAFFAQGDCVTVIFISLSFPSCVVLPCSNDSLFPRPDVAVHQPGHPHLHWMLGDPQGAGGPLLQDPVPHSGCTQHLRALGKVHPLAESLYIHKSRIASSQASSFLSSNSSGRLHAQNSWHFFWLF